MRGGKLPHQGLPTGCAPPTIVTHIYCSPKTALSTACTLFSDKYALFFV